MGAQIYVALGGNLASVVGNPDKTLVSALRTLSTFGVIVRAVSSFYRSVAWPNPHDPTFVNAVAQIETTLTPTRLLHLLHAVEATYGRKRIVRNGPRTLDLDIVDYRALSLCGPPILPHPRLSQRAFVLVPLREIAPDWRHPETGQNIETLCRDLPQSELAGLKKIEKSDLPPAGVFVRLPALQDLLRSENGSRYRRRLRR